MSPQDQRDNLELAVLFKAENQFTAKQAIVRAFEQMLVEYIVEWLGPDVGAERADMLRHKCGGIMDALTSMGIKIDAAVNESVQRQVKQSLRTD